MLVKSGSQITIAASADGDDHVVDVHMGNLRKKLGESGSNPRFIHTVRGVGFRFEATS